MSLKTQIKFKILFFVRKILCKLGKHHFSWSAYASLNVADYNKIIDFKDYGKFYFCDKCSWCQKEKFLSRIYPLLGIKEMNAKIFEEYNKG